MSEEVEDFNVVEFSVPDVPQYLPLHPTLFREFESSTTVSEKQLHTIDSLITTLMKNTKNFVNFSIENSYLLEESNDIDNYLQGQLKTLTNLLSQKHQLSVFKNSIDTSKAKIKHTQNNAPEISLDMLETYAISGELPLSERILYDYEETKAQHSQSLDSVLQFNTDYNYLKNCSFILKNPEDSVPDDSVSGDIEISGGKISLKDPISRNYFEDPWISRRCNHVYERKYVFRELANKRSCPVDGCNAVLDKNDLVPDDLMKLRVKVFLALEKNKKANLMVERLD